MHGLLPDSSERPAVLGRPVLRSGDALLRYGYPSSRPTAAQAWSMACSTPGNRLPPVYLSESDRRHLAELLQTCLADDPLVARALASEMARAVVLDPEEMPDDVVTMNARVVYRVGPGHRLRFGKLVYPEQPSTTADDISIASPRGVALLGLAENSLMPFADRDGTARWLSVQRVVH